MKLHKYAIALASASILATPNTAFADVTIDDVSEAAQKPKKITDRKHPDYMRCRSEPVIGSRVKKNRICMTNREWKAFNAEGNRRANEFVKDHQSGSTSN